nr:hypothetical protein [Tanacetum cinerariifolium]
MEAHLASTQPTQENKVTSSCEICSGPHDTQYCMEDPEQAFVEYTSLRNNDMGNRKFITNQGPRNFNEAINTWKDKPNFNQEQTQVFMSLRNGSISTHSSNYQTKLEKALDEFDSHQEKRLSRNSMDSKNIASISHIKREELRRKGIKILSKLFSPKYLSPASIVELNKNPSALKRVYFVNSIVILSKESDRKPKKDKIGSKQDKNGKHGEAEKIQKQLQWIKKEKTKENEKRRAK